MSTANSHQRQISIVFGALFLLVGSLVVSISFSYADSEEVTYDIGIEKIEDKFVYGKSKGQLGVQFTVVLHSDVDEPKAKSSLNMRCEAVPAAGEKFDLGEYVKEFRIKVSGTQTRKFFLPLDGAGAKFVKRMPSDAGTFQCTFNLPGNIVIKKNLFSDSNLSNDTVGFEVQWDAKNKNLKVSNFEYR